MRTKADGRRLGGRRAAAGLHLGAAASHLSSQSGGHGRLAVPYRNHARRAAGGGSPLVHGGVRARQPDRQLSGDPFAPELAASTLRTLALFQGRVEDPFRDEEPGKILHELRLGELTAFEERPHSPYYGAADSTMLFLIVLEEYVRWTGDRALARELEREARGAVAWIDRYGDRDHDGFVEYKRGNDKTGLDNQCWKDSWDSIAFADGTIAPLPRATCELQGYVYDAKLRTARLAREVWNDPVWAKQLETQALELKETIQPGVLDPRTELLRAGARWSEAKGRFPHLEHRPSALERDRRRREGRQLRQAPDERRAVFRLGDPNHGQQRTQATARPAAIRRDARAFRAFDSRVRPHHASRRHYLVREV